MLCAALIIVEAGGFKFAAHLRVNRRRVEMKQYAYLVVALLVACSDYGGGSKPATSSSSAQPAKSTAPAASTTTSAASPAKRDKLENSPLVWKPTTNVSSIGSVDLTGLSNTKLQVAKVADGRQNPTLLGENKEKGRPARHHDGGRCAAVRHRAHEAADLERRHQHRRQRRDACAQGRAQAVLCRRRSDTYKADVRMIVTLTNAAGKPVWNGHDWRQRAAVRALLQGRELLRDAQRLADRGHLQPAAQSGLSRLPVPEASLPAVEICSDRSAAG